MLWDVRRLSAGVGGVGHPDADILALALALVDGDGNGTVAVHHVLCFIRARVAAAEGVGGAPCNTLSFTCVLHANKHLSSYGSELV